MFSLIISSLRDLMRPRRDLLLENLALRQQILVLRRTKEIGRPRIPFEVIVLIKRMSRENPIWDR